ncbi:MAG: hypothetical protein GY853_16940, partial [PVC group bacterium]|nr:hypothetical protein [PVC group bacterium]
MLKTDFTRFTYRPIDLRKIVKSQDYWKYEKAINPENINRYTEIIAEDFSNQKQALKKINVSYIGGKKIFTVGTLYDALTIRRTNDIMKRTFYISTIPRDLEVKQLWMI